MKTELHYYDIFPKVFPAGKEVEITIKPLGAHAECRNPDEIYLAIYGLDDGNPRDYPHRKNGTKVDMTAFLNSNTRFPVNSSIM